MQTDIYKKFPTFPQHIRFSKTKWLLFGKHWHYSIHSNSIVVIRSPTMHKFEKSRLGFRLLRQVYKELFEFEDYIYKKNYRIWIAWTQITNDDTMHAIARIGAQPYFLNIHTNHIFFYKIIKGE